MTNPQSTNTTARDLLSKVPQVTIAFWIIKILATTLGETGGDALSMQLKLGYAVSTLIFLTFFAITLTAQLRAKQFHPAFYWMVVVATTTVGTTTSDYIDRTLGLGYIVSSIMLFLLVLIILATWRFATGKIQFDHVTDRKNEFFYWITILVSNTLGTALGDFTADSAGIGFEGGAIVFASLLAIVAILHFTTKIPKTILFWSAYVLSRPLGATLGDTLTKPTAIGGLNLSRIMSSLVIAAVMIVLITITNRSKREPQRLSNAPHN
jgi:uncharacterized membrane-anchored protein